MTDSVFVRLDAVMALHDRAVALFGGLPGLRDAGLLESALARPGNLFGYAPEGAVDLYDLAAAYAFGIAKNHSFHDANKRTAWTTCVLFLRVNGVVVAPLAGDVVERMVALASGGLDEAGFASWLRGLPTR